MATPITTIAFKIVLQKEKHRIFRRLSGKQRWQSSGKSFYEAKTADDYLRSLIADTKRSAKNLGLKTRVDKIYLCSGLEIQVVVYGPYDLV